MPRVHRSIDDIHHEFSDDFTVVNGNLLLCKFCDTIVKWRKKTRVIEHMSTRMHAERKEAKLKRLLQVSLILYFWNWFPVCQSRRSNREADKTV